jgi:hypothetical protein
MAAHWPACPRDACSASTEAIVTADAQLELQEMTEADIERIARFHAHVPQLTPAAFAYEYLANPNPSGRLYFAADPSGRVVASQAFVTRDLMRDGSVVPTLMSERTLLAPELRGKVNYGEFYAAALQRSARLAGAELVWGGTAARKAFEHFGFTATDSIFVDVLILRTKAIAEAWTAQGASLKSKVLHSLHRSYARARRLSMSPRQSRLPLRVADRQPSANELRELAVSVSRANPTSYFLDYSPEVIDWLVVGNPFKRRKLLSIRDSDRLIGIAVLEDRDDKLSHVIELLLADASLATDAFAAIVATAKDSGGLFGVTLWGNGANPYVATLREGFCKLGSVNAPNATLIVHRATPIAQHPAPDASSLAMTGLWSAPV